MIRDDTHVTMKPYQKNYPKFFREEKDKIRKILGKDNQTTIYHVGSTAVPNLGGKEIIDVLIVTKSNLKTILRRLKKDGYHHIKEADDEERIFLNRDYKNKMHVHIHLTTIGKKTVGDFLYFRNYMRKNPKEAKKYFELKRKWAKRAKKRTCSNERI